jgi:hypothetical protein
MNEASLLVPMRFGHTFHFIYVIGCLLREYLYFLAV